MYELSNDQKFCMQWKMQREYLQEHYFITQNGWIAINNINYESFNAAWCESLSAIQTDFAVSSSQIAVLVNINPPQKSSTAKLGVVPSRILPDYFRVKPK